MAKTGPNPKLDGFFNRAKNWQAELKALRAIALELPLAEEIKWGQPCYTVEGRNVFLITAFKNYAVVMFVKGALLKDTGKLLVRAGENTQAARQLRFTSLAEVKKKRGTVKRYMRDAMKAEQAGRDVVFKKVSAMALPAELTAALRKNKAFKKAFDSLTPGRQRGYIIYIGGAKQAATRLARIEKIRPLVMQGLGLNDNYVKSSR